MQELAEDQLTTVRGGFTPEMVKLWQSALLSPPVVAWANAGFHMLGTPVRAFGELAPEAVKMMAAGAKLRHDVLSAMVHPGNAYGQAVHDGYTRSFYGKFASHLPR